MTKEQTASAPRPSGDVAADNREDGCLCQSCGARFKVDFMVPDFIWDKISDGKNLLCGNCVATRIERLGEFGAFELRDLCATTPASGDVAAKLGEKRAPVQGYVAGIPWEMHLRAYDVYCKKHGPQQALIEGWCRGGFGTGELDDFIPGWREELSERTAMQKQIADLTERIATLEQEGLYEAVKVLAAERASLRRQLAEARAAMDKVAHFWRAKIDDRTFAGCCERIILEYEAGSTGILSPPQSAAAVLSQMETPAPQSEERVDVYKGKYTVILRSDGTSTALRHGHEWPAYRGEKQLDNLTCALARDLIEARGGEAEARLKGIHEAFDCCRQIVRAYGGDRLTQEVRKSLIAMMDHMEGTAK